MHFYQHNLGDWAAHTDALDWLELAAYHKLIQIYYLHERPLPNDSRALHRITRAVLKSERDAVDRVVRRFFVLDPSDGLLHQKRCDAELERYGKVRQTKVENVSKRWNGEMQDPPKEGEGRVSPNVAKTMISGSRNKHDFESGLLAPSTSPHPAAPTGLQRPYNGGNTVGNTAVIPPIKHELKLSPNTHIDQAARAAAAAGVCVSVGVQVEAGNTRMLALLADGATPADFAEAARMAATAGKGWAYCAGIVANRLSEASRMPQEGLKSGAGGPNYPMLPRWDDPH